MDASARVQTGGAVRLTTVNGEIALHLPRDTSVVFSARVGNGSISVTNLVLPNEVRTSTSLRGTLGAGNGTVSLQTTNGAIRATGRRDHRVATDVLEGTMFAIYLASVMAAGWGIAHLFATTGVVKGFGDISLDNRRIITMEWIVEGVALLSTAAFVAVVTMVAPGTPASTAVYGVAIATLLVLAGVSLATGFKIAFFDRGPWRPRPG